jgi:predicted  nucleic acid-binding Zn-ribbon protein
VGIAVGIVLTVLLVLAIIVFAPPAAEDGTDSDGADDGAGDDADTIRAGSLTSQITDMAAALLRLTGLQTALDHLQRIPGLQAAVDLLNTQVIGRLAELATLTADITRLTGVSGALQTTLTSLTAQSSVLTSSIAALTGRESTLQASIGVATEQITAVTGLVSGAATEVARLTGIRDGLSSEMANLQGLVGVLTGSRGLEEEEEGLQTRRGRQEREGKEGKGEAPAVTGANRPVVTGANRPVVTGANRPVVTVGPAAPAGTLGATLAAAQRRLAALRAQATGLAAQRTAAQAAVAQIQTATQTLTAQRTGLQAAHRTAIAERDAARSTGAALQTQRNQVQANYNTSAAQLTSLRTVQAGIIIPVPAWGPCGPNRICGQGQCRASGPATPGTGRCLREIQCREAAVTDSVTPPNNCAEITIPGNTWTACGPNNPCLRVGDRCRASGPATPGTGRCMSASLCRWAANADGSIPARNCNPEQPINPEFQRMLNTHAARR